MALEAGVGQGPMLSSPIPPKPVPKTPHSCAVPRTGQLGAVGSHQAVNVSY